jgi:hypothetical protein
LGNLENLKWLAWGNLWTVPPLASDECRILKGKWLRSVKLCATSIISAAVLIVALNVINGAISG